MNDKVSHDGLFGGCLEFGVSFNSVEMEKSDRRRLRDARNPSSIPATGSVFLFHFTWRFRVTDAISEIKASL